MSEEKAAMAELPSIPDGVVSKYTPSGKSNAGVAILFILLGLPLSIVLGMIVVPIGLAVSAGLIYLLAHLPGLVLVLIIPLLGIVLVSTPVFYGHLAGKIFWGFARAGKCRSTSATGTIAFFSGFLGFLSFQILYNVGFFTSVLKMSLSLILTAWWVYAIAVVGALISGYCCYHQSTKRIRSIPFCETAMTWYVDLGKKHLSRDSAESIAHLLNGGAADAAEISEASKSRLPRLEFQMMKCPQCENDPYKLTVVEHYTETVTEKGKTVTKTKERNWIDGMIEARRGKALAAKVLKA